MEGISVGNSWSFRLVGFKKGVGFELTTTFTTKAQRTQRTHKENYKIWIMTFLFVRLCAFFVISVSLW